MPQNNLSYPMEAPAAGQWREVCKGVYWLRQPMPMALNHINVWLLEDGGQGSQGRLLKLTPRS